MLRHRIFTQVFLQPRKVQNAKDLALRNVRWNTTVAQSNETKCDEALLAAAKPFEQIPSMYMLPGIGTAWIYLPVVGLYDIHKQHLASIDKRRRLGDVFREKIGPLNMVCSFNPDDMQVLFKHEGEYPTRGEFESLKAYRESRKQWYTSTGILILQGKEWHDLRSKTQKHLLKPKAIRAYLDPMQDVTRDFINKMLKIRDNNKEVPDFLCELYKWALESVALVGLDARLGCFDINITEDSDGMKMIHSVQTQFECMNELEALSGNIPLWKIFPTPTWRKFTKAADVFTEIAFRYINRSLEELEKNTENENKEITLLQSMLMTKGLDVSGAMVTVADMLTAGIDTTSHSVGFFLYNLAKNPDKQEMLYKEIRKLLPRKEDRITPEVFNELKYLKATMKESQRLHPIVFGIPRVLDHDVVFGGYRVPAGTFLVVGLQSIYKDERYFPNPDQFLPERWLNKDEKYHPFAFVPFGVGTRSCIGRRLAEQEIVCLIAEIIRNFKVEYHHEDIGMFSRLINTPDKPLRFNFIER